MLLAIVVAAPTLADILEETSIPMRKQMASKSSAQTIAIALALFVILFAIFATIIHFLRKAASRVDAARTEANTARRAAGRQSAVQRGINARHEQVELRTMRNGGRQPEPSGFDSADTLPAYDPTRPPDYANKSEESLPFDTHGPGARPSTSAEVARPGAEGESVQAIPAAQIADRIDRPLEVYINRRARADL